MSGDLLGVFGILVTLIVGVPALFFAGKRIRKTQNQRTDRGSIGIQAGKDVKIGVKND